MYPVGFTKAKSCAFPIPKCKKYPSFGELLEARRTCDRIERGNTKLPYRDTAERLQTILARERYLAKKMNQWDGRGDVSLL
jgi:hypothetical protein